MIRVFPSRRIRLGTTAILALVGAPPDRAVNWAASTGTITPITAYTDVHGRAFARWTPDEEGAAVIGATYGA